METTGIKRACTGWSQPLLIIYARWGSTISHNGLGPHPSLVTPHFYRSYIAQFTTLYHINGIFEMLLASLPLATLYHFIISLLCCNHRSAFNNRITNRLFYIHIFTGFAGMNHHQGMPMIWCANDYSINIFLSQ